MAFDSPSELVVRSGFGLVGLECLSVAALASGAGLAFTWGVELGAGDKGVKGFCSALFTLLWLCQIRQLRKKPSVTRMRARVMNVPISRILHTELFGFSELPLLID